MAGPGDFAQSVQACTDRLAELGVDALGALFDLTSDRLVRFAITLTRNQHDAEDSVQAALVRVACEPSLLADVAAPWAYLLRMVRNEALGIARRSRRCVAAGELIDLATRCRVDELEREDTYRAVWTAMRALPPEQAEVVVLKIWEEMTFSQIGEILDASPHTVASRYKYAMAKLSRTLVAQHREVER